MSTKKYRIRLTTDEQQELNALVSRGRAAAYKQTHARILLMSDESRSDGGMKDADITSALGVGQSTVERIRKRCVCMDRTHGGRVFGDMVDTFEYVRHRA